MNSFCCSLISFLLPCMAFHVRRVCRCATKHLKRLRVEASSYPFPGFGNQVALFHLLGISAFVLRCCKSMSLCSTAISGCVEASSYPFPGFGNQVALFPLARHFCFCFTLLLIYEPLLYCNQRARCKLLYICKLCLSWHSYPLWARLALAVLLFLRLLWVV